MKSFGAFVTFLLEIARSFPNTKDERKDNMHSHQKQTNLQQAREVPLKACKTIKHPFQRACALHVISICQQEDQTTPCRAHRNQSPPSAPSICCKSRPKVHKTQLLNGDLHATTGSIRPWDSRFKGLALAIL